MNNIIALFDVDVDPDRPSFGGEKYDFFGHQKWEGARRGIPEFLTFKKDLEKSLDCIIHFTWFLRVDHQIDAMYDNDKCYYELYKEVAPLLLDEGEEVAWHAHTWRWNKEQNSWFQEIDDEEWIKSIYKKGFSDFKEILGFSPISFRAGWCFHNNASMNQLDELGLKVDLSAMPGIKNPGEKNDEGSLFNGFADWERTECYPYQPSKEDYRISSANHHELLEIPMTTFKKPLISFISQILPIRFVGGVRLAKPIITFTKYSLSLTFHHLLFNKGIQSAFESFQKSDTGIIHGSLHADELLSKPLLDNLGNNIKKLISMSEEQNFTTNFLTAKEAYDFYIKQLSTSARY